MAGVARDTDAAGHLARQAPRRRRADRVRANPGARPRPGFATARRPGLQGPVTGGQRPYTAIQAIEHLSVLFAALAARPVGPLVTRDPSGTVTVAVPGRSFSEHLALGVGLIRRYGAQEPTVVQALLRLLSTVATVGAAGPDLRAAIERQADLVITAAEREVVEPADLAIVYAEADALREALSTRRAEIPPRRAIDSGELPTTPPS